MAKSLYGFEIRDRRRVVDSSQKKWQIKELWDLSREIIRLKATGMKNTTIASYLNCTKTTVTNTINSDLGKAELRNLRAAIDAETVDVAARIKNMEQEALDVYEEILEKEDVEDSIQWMRLKKDTSDTVIKDLGGHEAPKKIAVGHFGISEINAIKERGKRIAKENGSIINVTPEEAVNS